MRKISVIAFCFVASAAIAGPMDFKGKMKDGLYEITTSMDMSGMPGMPQGMKMSGVTTQKCISRDSMENGSGMFGQQGQQDEMSKDCTTSNFNMSGDTATYRIVCTGKNKMEMDGSVTLTGNGYNGANKMKMKQDGQDMNMTANFVGKYLGACK